MTAALLPMTPATTPLMTPTLNPFFPKAELSALITGPGRPLDEAPERISPILDEANFHTPLLAYDERVHQSSYGETPSDAPEAVLPPQPDSFQDPYLFPTLARNERLRLTILWYHTRLVTKNRQLMGKLQDIVTLVQKFMGWEFALVGMLDEAVYTRLATVNLPLLKLPRREGTCSHTINQPLGTVFNISNMAEDWRFKSSPHVEIGGLRSYAGTQLRLKTDAGEEVALGSLCIASNTVQLPLTPEQKISLVQFADMLTNELVSALRQNRLRERQAMFEALMVFHASSTTNEDEFKSNLVMLIQKFFPDSTISIQTSERGLVRLDSATKIRFSDVQTGLWENTALIDETIKTGNYAQLKTSHPARAIVSKAGHFPSYVVVASSDIQHVFDDYDAWFVEKCSQALGELFQEIHLQEALKAKEAFLRGITHQLRTPIHGVLTSTELLAEELAVRRMSEQVAQQFQRDVALTHLKTIRESGTELMATVNDLLKLNNWTRNQPPRIKPTQYDLSQFEADMSNGLLDLVSGYETAAVIVSFENELDEQRKTVIIDNGLLKDTIQPLLVNALQVTRYGRISVVISSPQESGTTLQIDIKDMGCGIPQEDQQRIFQAFEKGSVHASGAGLGLTLSAKAAHLLGGTVELVSSQQDFGSHFRVLLHELVFLPSSVAPTSEIGIERLPRGFFILASDSDPSDLTLHFAEHLRRRDFAKMSSLGGGLILMDNRPLSDPAITTLRQLSTPHAIICITRAPSHHSSNDELQNLLPQHAVVVVAGPLFPSRMDQIILQADQLLPIIESIPLTNGHDATRIDESSKGTEPVQAPDCKTTLITDLHSVAKLSLLQPSPTTSVPRAHRALIVDDNIVNLRVLRMYCQKRAIPFVSAMNGAEAIDEFIFASTTSDPVDLVLMDLQMPVCGGLEACAKIRAFEADKELRKSVMFMVTGQDSPEDRLRSIEAGADEYFVKPLSLKSLDRWIAKYMSNR